MLGCLLEAVSALGGRRESLKGPPLTALVFERWGGEKKHSLRCWELWSNQAQISLPLAPRPHRPGYVFFLRCLRDVGRAPWGFCQWQQGAGLYPLGMELFVLLC